MDEEFEKDVTDLLLELANGGREEFTYALLLHDAEIRREAIDNYLLNPDDYC